MSLHGSFLKPEKLLAHGDILDAMRKMSLSDVERLAAEVIAPKRVDAVSGNSWKQAKTRLDPLSWLLRRRRKKSDVWYTRPPGSDHDSYWVNEQTKDRIFVTQPYCLSMDVVQQMIFFAQEHDLRFEIDGYRSFWFPGHTVYVVWAHRPSGRGAE